MPGDETVDERGRISDLSRGTIGAKARRSLEDGVLGLADRRASADHGQQRYPEAVAGCMLSLQQRYTAINCREIGRIIAR